MIPLENYLFLSALIFLCGVYAVLFRRNVIFVMMGIELMLNAVNLVFVSAATSLGNIDGQIMVFFIITVAACEAAVGLAMVIAFFRKYGTIDTDFMRVLRG